MNYEQRQVYRLINEQSCNKWIETLNAAIIYAKFFWKLMQESNNEVSKYFSKLKEEIAYIEFEETIDAEYKQKQQLITKENSQIISKKELQENNKGHSQIEKKKERRKNPHTALGNITFLII